MLKRTILTAIIVLTLGMVAHADTWHFDKAHSTIGFAVRHMVISKTTGEFTDFDGTVQFDGKSLEAGTVNVTIKMASVDTDNADRDKHLKSDEFFDVANYPDMTFKSKKITKGEGNEFAMTGTLTIKGISKEVTLKGEFNGVIDDPWGNTRAGFTAETTINRQDFNVSFDNTLKDGSLVVGNDVDIQLEIELVKAK